MKASRILWRIAYPFAYSLNLFGWLSYKWVNVSKSAWITSETGFGELWHYEWFGDEIDAIPERVVLCGIGYRVAVSEGLVVFREACGMSAARIEFRRDPHDQYGFLWYLELNGCVSASHVEEAYKWVKAVYGGSHERKRPAIRVSQDAG
jgi:hypothetical protein